MKVLHISSSIHGEHGNSSQLATHFLTQIQQQHPDAEIVVRDLAQDPVPHLDAATFKANITPAEQRTPEQQQLANLADTLIEELQSADVLVLSVPMYNFGIPSSLKAWIDAIARAGTTFKYTENGPVGLLSNTKTYVLGARGGEYLGTAKDTQTPYLETVLAFVGLVDVEFVFAEKLSMQSEQASQIMDEAKTRIDGLLGA
ncbi:MAG: FMN-dependent NADH-azoreductase [Pseudomonadota bacterium]|nr:FMN-dependent NADH-azoreductase [Pseudomonadota bacterium]